MNGPRSTKGRVFLAAAVTVVSSLPVFLVGALAVQLAAGLRFHVGLVGALVAAYRGSSALTAMHAGRITDRFGGPTAMRIAAGISALSCLLIAIVARQWLVLGAVLCLSGVANTMGQTGANRFMFMHVPDDRRGVAFGVKQSAPPTAAFLAGLAVPAFAVTAGWRWAFVSAAALAAVVACFVPREPATLRIRSVTPACVATHRAPLGLLTLGLGLGAGATSAMSGFFVASAVASGVGPATSGLLYTLGSAASIGTRIVCGHLADKKSSGHLSAVAIMLLAGAAGYACLAIGLAAVIPLAAIIAFSMGWGFNGLFWLAVVRSSPSTPGAATGRVMLGGNLGGIVCPLLFGLAVTHLGYGAAWLGTAAASAAAGAVIFAGNRALVRYNVTADGTRPASQLLHPSAD